MKTGLVMEGGAMRGMFTAGVTDVMLEHHVTFDGAIGVSAGAVFGCNYKSKQIKRAVRYNVRYCRDPRYASYRSLLTTGNLFGEQLCYHDIPEVLDPMDEEAYIANPMEFWVVCTDVDTGKAVYHRCDTPVGENIEWFRASASMPLVSRIVEVGGYRLLDGGVADSIPIRKFQEMGYERNVVILTQPKGFIKEVNPMLKMIKMKYRHEPKLVEAVANRHILYNETTAYLEEEEKAGRVFVVRPPYALRVRPMEHDRMRLLETYQLGRNTGKAVLAEMEAFLQEAKAK